MHQEEARKALESFAQRFPQGQDDIKAPEFYKQIAKNFGFRPQKIGFVVVAHKIRRLSYFLEALTAMGIVVAIIPKTSKYVPDIESFLDVTYRQFIRHDINKEVLNSDESEVKIRSFLQEISDKHPDRRFIILDHGGKFARRLDVLNEFSGSIAGIVEHTRNGHLEYEERLKTLQFIPPVFSIADSSLKAMEDPHVAASIIDAMRTYVFAGSGISQELSRLKIGIIGYGHMGEAIAMQLHKRVPPTNIMICDKSESRRASAKKVFISVVTDSEMPILLEKCDVVIAAADAQILGSVELEHMKSGACVICVTSGDSLFKSDYFEGLKKAEGEPSFVTAYKRRRGDTIYLAGDGSSVNFRLGETQHPVMHAIYASVCVAAYRCLADGLPVPVKGIRKLSERDIKGIETIYKETFDPASELDIQIQEYCRQLATTDSFEDLGLYIAMAGSLMPGHSSTFDLCQRVHEFMSSGKKVLLLLGESGSGKSLFGQFLVKQMARNYIEGGTKFIPLFISLPMFLNPKDDNQDLKTRLIEKALAQHGFSTADIEELKRTRQLFIVLDAYDEIHLQKNLYKTNALQQWQAIVISTCRSSYLTSLANYRLYFTPFNGESAVHGALQEIHVAPFSPTQINDYIDRYVGAKEKDLRAEIACQSDLGEEWLNPGTYKTRVEQIPQLKELVQTPFLLKITMETLPTLVAQYEEMLAKGQHFYMTRLKLYDAFMDRWFKRQEEKLMGLGLHPGRSMYTDYFAFTEGLAKAMHEANVTQITYLEESDVVESEGVAQTKWARFFSDELVDTDRGDDKRRKRRIAARKGCPLRRVGLNQHAFIHTSLIDYFVSRFVRRQMLTSVAPKATDILGIRELSEPSSASEAGRGITLRATPPASRALQAGSERPQVSSQSIEPLGRSDSVVGSAAVARPVVFSGQAITGGSLAHARTSVDINPDYQYEDYDITAILISRLSQEITEPRELGENGRIQALAAIDGMAPNQLERQLSENREAHPGARIILIPYNAGHYHWIGILLEFNSENQIVRALHLDSLGQHDLEVLQQRLNRADYRCELRSIRLLVQYDGTSCGAYTTENLILAVTNREVPNPNPNASDIRRKHLSCLEALRPDFYNGPNGFYQRQKANHITAINRQFISGTTSVVFSAVELKKISDITDCIKKLSHEASRGQLWAALQPKPAHDIDKKLHLDEIRFIIKSVVNLSVSNIANGDWSPLQRLIRLLFGAEWSIDMPFTDELMNTFCVDYEQIVAIVQRKDIDTTSIEQSQIRAKILEQIESDEVIARRLQTQLWAEAVDGLIVSRALTA